MPGSTARYLASARLGHAAASAPRSPHAHDGDWRPEVERPQAAAAEPPGRELRRKRASREAGLGRLLGLLRFGRA